MFLPVASIIAGTHRDTLFLALCYMYVAGAHRDTLFPTSNAQDPEIYIVYSVVY